MSFNFVEKVICIGGNGTEVPTLQFYRKGFNLGGSASPTWRDIILHGVTALTLVNAKADSLEYLKLFGGTEFVPETYLDTVTLDGATRQSNVPEGYTEVEYLESTGTQWINTGYYPNTNTKFEISGTQGSTDCALFGLTLVFYCFNNSSVTTYYGFCGDSGSFNFVMKNVPVVLNMSASDGIVINGTKYIDLIAGSETANYPMALFGRMDNSTGRIAKLGDHIIRYAKIYENNILIHNYIPCRRNSDNVLGMYDTVTGNFLTNAGSGSFTAGADVTTPSPDYPIDIVCNNGAIKVSKNLFDQSLFNTDVGPTITYKTYNIPNGTYTMSSPDFTLSNYNTNVFVFAGQVTSGASSTTNGVSSTTPRTITVTDGKYTVAYRSTAGGSDSRNPKNYNWQVELGSTATSYMPYGQIYVDGIVETVTDSNQLTASAEMLLAVDDIKDTQEVLNGSVTRNVGIYVLDGTETWAKSNTYTGSFYTSNTAPPDGAKVANNPNVLCSHGFKVDNLVDYSSAQVGAIYWYSPIVINYKYDDGTATVAQFKQWLADQYNAGTPVTIVYPLATATTETVSKQLLTKSPVTQTAGSISNMTITTTESSHTTPTPDNPLYLKCNNGVIKVSPNKYNASTRVEGYSISASGVVGPASGFCYSALIPVKPNTTYILSAYQNAIGGANKRVHAYDSNGDWLQQLGVVGVTGEKSYSLSFTTTATTKYIRISISMNDTTVQVEVGSTATSYMPYGQIYTDGTTETVESHSKNLFDNTSTVLHLASDNYVLVENNERNGRYIKVNPSTTYTISRTSSAYLNVCETTQIPTVGLSVAYIAMGTVATYTLTTSATTQYLYIYSGALDSITTGDIQIEQGSTATTYEPYYYGGSATAENLFKVGTYQDVQSVIDGEVTRNIGIKVLDGTEDWSRQGTSSNPYWSLSKTDLGTNSIVLPSSSTDMFCTHYKVQTSAAVNKIIIGASYINFVTRSIYTTLNSWEQFLADQYNAGTPVILVYPISSPTTETVTAQQMNIQAGTNIVQITQASIDNLELEVKYKAGVEVTITEIENAQLDDNVEVTING